jgi:hypothetical protein
VSDGAAVLKRNTRKLVACSRVLGSSGAGALDERVTWAPESASYGVCWGGQLAYYGWETGSVMTMSECERRVVVFWRSVWNN